MGIAKLLTCQTLVLSSLVAVFYAAGSSEPEYDPNNTVQVEPEEEEAFMERLPVGLAYGGIIGAVNLGICSLAYWRLGVAGREASGEDIKDQEALRNTVGLMPTTIYDMIEPY